MIGRGVFASQAGRETETRLQHLLELRGIGLLTGEAGCGKTSICRRVTASLHPGLFRVFYVSLTTGSVLDTYQAIAWELGLAGESKQFPVLVIDEAHHLRNDVLEDLRLVTNFEMDSEHRLCLLFIGLTELRRRLSMAVHESLAQRIVVRQHLAGLDRDELEPYLAHRLSLAGCQLPLFEPAALEALFQASRGLPRRINGIAHYALAAAAIDQARAVSSQHLERGCQELAK